MSLPVEEEMETTGDVTTGNETVTSLQSSQEQLEQAPQSKGKTAEF